MSEDFNCRIAFLEGSDMAQNEINKKLKERIDKIDSSIIVEHARNSLGMQNNEERIEKLESFLSMEDQPPKEEIICWTCNHSEAFCTCKEDKPTDEECDHNWFFGVVTQETVCTKCGVTIDRSTDSIWVAYEKMCTAYHEQNREIERLKSEHEKDRDYIAELADDIVTNSGKRHKLEEIIEKVLESIKSKITDKGEKNGYYITSEYFNHWIKILEGKS